MLASMHAQHIEPWRPAQVGAGTAIRFKEASDCVLRGMPTAKCIAYAAQVAVERVSGEAIAPVFQTMAMREAAEQVPAAMNAYEVRSGNLVDQGAVFQSGCGNFHYCPAGVVNDDGLMEVVPLMTPDEILKAIGHGDLKEYVPQCVGGLYVTGRRWVDLVLWAPALAKIGRQLTVQRITRGETAMDQMGYLLHDFTAAVLENERLLRGTEQSAAPAFPQLALAA